MFAQVPQVCAPARYTEDMQDLMNEHPDLENVITVGQLIDVYKDKPNEVEALLVL